MMKWLTALTMLLVLSACGGEEDLDGVLTISSDELQTQVEAGLEETVQYVDVREPDEFAEAAVPGFENIPMDDVIENPSIIDEERDVVILCQTQNRSAEVAESLIEAGFDEERVIVVEGGISDYEGAKE
ncbi:rhodanese-like domain-containing protein [Salisediminibacterium beveridgei]|uniref:Rhodanese Domain-Containing Protein n=1 Tax=Salisediminibacterium beveridgei TaxID=632773 RepID=A0A1D7QZ79_9BACI|nr:rhodanese-like domain-containing protein [Salisediminibacterium beveridgei]AOM84316.1 Rhodanese Domain-Containing Protein [Salisediminibacterium beveridgei]